MTSIAQPTSRRSPSHPGVEVHASIRSPCASCRARSTSTGSAGTAAGGGTSGKPRQRPERARHPDVLPGRARREPHAPGEPGGAGAEAVVPAAARVELANEVEQVRGGGVEVRGQLGDLVAQPIQLHGGLSGGAKVECRGVHGRFSFCSAPTLHSGFGAIWGARRAAITARSTFFTTNPATMHPRASADR